MKCENCGASITEDTHSCPNCGEVTGASAGGKTQTKRRTNIYLALVIAVLAALLVFAIYCTVKQVVANEGAILFTQPYSMGSTYSTQVSTPTVETQTQSQTEETTPLTTEKPSTETETPVTEQTVQETIIGTRPADVTETTPVMGKSTVTKEELVDFYNKYSPVEFPAFYRERGVTLEQFAQMYLDECETENVRADLAFAQMVHETGFLRFGGKVTANQLNFAGLGTSEASPGINFATLYGNDVRGIQTGVRAQVQHLKAYASIDQLIEENVDPLFSQVQRGSAQTIGELSGTWSKDANYAKAILKYIHFMGESE